jgi:K+-sensing histidine kinase KdpD
MFQHHLQTIIALLKDNPVLAIIVAGIVLILFYTRPKQVFKIVCLCLVFFAFIYAAGLLFGTLESGSKQKDEMIHKTRQAIEEEK